MNMQMCLVASRVPLMPRRVRSISRHRHRNNLARNHRLRNICHEKMKPRISPAWPITPHAEHSLDHTKQRIYPIPQAIQLREINFTQSRSWNRVVGQFEGYRLYRLRKNSVGR